jgi:hypothetical protein
MRGKTRSKCSNPKASERCASAIGEAIFRLCLNLARPFFATRDCLIRARLLEIKDELDRLANDRQRIGGDIAEAEAKLRGMQGSDAASVAAESRQQALADMGEAVERWARLIYPPSYPPLLLRFPLDRLSPIARS